MIGMALVVLFMLVYYRWFGLAANIALAANMTLIVAIMSVLGATLTMPGIAGIVLTIGMAVDANVLIFSRIREELKQRPAPAGDSGGIRSCVRPPFWTPTSPPFSSQSFCFPSASGPVKGFAVTLAVGIVTSMFTAIMGTRSLINLMYGGRELKSVNI